MDYVRLGNSGLKISKVVLGAMSFGEHVVPGMGWTLTEDKALPILKHAFDAGLNTWDTADVYGNGDSERIIGKALKTYKIPRERVVIMTKCCGGMPDDLEKLDIQTAIQQMTVNGGVMVNRVGLSRKHIFDAVDASVARLGTFIDVLQIHRMDPETTKEEIMKALNDVVESGKVRYIGSSSMPAWELQALQNVAKQNGWHQFISMQSYYSLLNREDERELIPYCKDAGIGLVPWSPLAQGQLARPFNSEKTDRQKADLFRNFMIGSTTRVDEEIIGRVEELAKKKGTSMAIVAMAWCIKKGVSPIVGLNSTDRVDEVLEAVRREKERLLDFEDVKFLDALYLPKPTVGMRPE